MGCNASLNLDLTVSVELNSPIFKVNSVCEKTPQSGSLSNFCQKVISSYINAAYVQKTMAFLISCKGKQYSINDTIRMNQLHLGPDDCISIEAILLDHKSIELNLKFLSLNAKEMIKTLNTSALLGSIVPKRSSRIIYEDLELDHDQKIENYEITNKATVYVIEDGNQSEEVQL